LNEADLTVFDEMLSPQLAYHSGTLPTMSAGDVAEKVLAPILAGFPDVEYTVQQAFSGDDVVTLIWSAQGTHTGPFQGYAPSGKRAAWTGTTSTASSADGSWRCGPSSMPSAGCARWA
jgi:hypothetical protein